MLMNRLVKFINENFVKILIKYIKNKELNKSEINSEKGR